MTAAAAQSSCVTTRRSPGGCPTLRPAPAAQITFYDCRNYVPLRYIIAFIYPLTATMRDFLAKKGHSNDQVEAMHQAWFKAVTLQAALWARPYVRNGLW